MSKEYIAKLATERNLSLNDYPDEDGATVWCWEDSDTHKASQVFASEEVTLEAMRVRLLAETPDCYSDDRILQLLK